MKILFLDVDGVLNHAGFPPSGKSRQLDPACCKRLAHITAVSGASIVVSSTWRLGVGLFELKTQLAHCGLEVSRIVDMTPDLHRARIKGPDGKLLLLEACRRGAEIDAWLTDHPEVTSFAILDDDSDMEPHMDRLVQTSWRTGLQDEHAWRVVAMLRWPIGESMGPTKRG